MQLKEIIKNLQLKVLSGERNLETHVAAGYTSDILSDVMAKTSKGYLWITNQNHQNVIAIVFFKDLAGVVIAGGCWPDEDTLQKAREKQIPVLLSSKTAYEVSGELYGLGIPGSA